MYFVMYNVAYQGGKKFHVISWSALLSSGSIIIFKFNSVIEVEDKIEDIQATFDMSCTHRKIARNRIQSVNQLVVKWKSNHKFDHQYSQYESRVDSGRFFAITFQVISLEEES